MARCEQNTPSQPHVGWDNLYTPAIAKQPSWHPFFFSLSTFPWPNPAQVLHPKPERRPPKQPWHTKEEEAGEMSSVLWLAWRFLSLSFPFREFIILSD